ncbi:hypothetical protein AWB73_00078 [Caballeronia turbans]|nr:hypothetical protein AWB73_00078 [Caballeronia turbans]
MSDRLMSAEDLARVTGKKTSTKQAEWFQSEFGVRVVRCADGSPVMTWATFEALMQKRVGILSNSTEPPRPALRPLRTVR